MLLKFLPVFLIFLLMTGCASTETVESTKVASTEIYQSYSIEGSKNSTKVNVTFRFGGSTGPTIDLDAPSSISHNGKPMTENAPVLFKGTDYNDSTNKFVPNHKFLYQDASGKVWVNEISMEGLEIVSQGLTISQSGGGTIMLSRPVGKDEKVVISLTSDKNPPAAKKAKSNSQANSNRGNQMKYWNNLEVSYDESRAAVKVNPSSVKNFVDGKASLSLTVYKEKVIPQSANGGSMNFRYESQKVAVNVVN